MKMPPMPAVQPLLNAHYDRSEALGAEITALFGFRAR